MRLTDANFLKMFAPRDGTSLDDLWERSPRHWPIDVYSFRSRISDGCPGNAASRRARKLEWIAGTASASASASAPTIKAPRVFMPALRWWKASRSSWWAAVKPPWTATGRLPVARSTSREKSIAEGCRSPEPQEHRRTRLNWWSCWRGKRGSPGK